MFVFVFIMAVLICPILHMMIANAIQDHNYSYGIINTIQCSVYSVSRMSNAQHIRLVYFLLIKIVKGIYFNDSEFPRAVAPYNLLKLIIKWNKINNFANLFRNAHTQYIHTITLNNVEKAKGPKESYDICRQTRLDLWCEKCSLNFISSILKRKYLDKTNE